MNRRGVPEQADVVRNDVIRTHGADVYVFHCVSNGSLLIPSRRMYCRALSSFRASGHLYLNGSCRQTPLQQEAILGVSM